MRNRYRRRRTVPALRPGVSAIAGRRRDRDSPRARPAAPLCAGRESR
ncbi:hypothetical protein GLE_3250 [Lysobacter enzymogenes]|uniref:Uncharacterized protein n=1 Tax=Lysobacter enzymogenes TaxID=69 RepID=A0A0S2DJA4_LYSEN|nr:hypothetical protein GLE_3250 [Lysobacter enzymogenes]